MVVMLAKKQQHTVLIKVENNQSVLCSTIAWDPFYAMVSCAASEVILTLLYSRHLEKEADRRHSNSLIASFPSAD